jgi:hypothetical protein
MKRKFSTTIICTSIVVVVFISAYSYYTIDFTKETESSSNVDDRAKTKGGIIIYKTMSGL